METIKIQGSTGSSTILIGERLQSLSKYIPVDRTVIVTDTNVKRYFGKDFPPCEVIEIGTGEGIKNLDTVQDIYGKLVELEADRSSFLVGIGGGVVSDITGFVGSTYMRGLKFGFVSSTLLSQVDASVGGKNGVNFGGYKNMVGVFNQPEFVICDIDLLETLPEREVRCGFAEIVKHAIIGDPQLFSYLEENCEKAVELDREVIERLVRDSVSLKASIVGRDEKEKGERRKLNFGHTFGHALEKAGPIPHGEAVSAGMVLASSLSVKRGLLSRQDFERIKGLLSKLRLPTALPMELKFLLDALKRDKKREGVNIFFVFLQGIGDPVLEQISLKGLEALARDLPMTRDP